MPNLNNMPVSDIYFLDSLTGWAVTNNSTPNDSGYILKTVNGGDNWSIKLKDRADFTRIKFVNQDTGFAGGGSGSGYPYIYKSTNGGENWIQLPVSTGNIFWNDMYVLNEDTIWTVDKNSFNGGVYLTTNGGISWQNRFSGSQNPDKIYMYNARIGFISFSLSPCIYKTTNSGDNWTVNLSNENFTDMYFVDSLIGWKCTNSSSQAGILKKTTNGGVNWTIQNLPPESPPFSFSRMFKFSFVNKDTIWGVGGVYTFNGGQSRGVIYKTTNGGLNWGYQIPDTNINIYIYNTIQFVNKRIGWAYSPSMGGVHTTTGGDTITGIQQISSEIPAAFGLKQNYPNPFNPVTNIIYALKTSAFVILKIFDITGRQISLLVNENQRAGVYRYIFDGSSLSSGIYFYSMQITSGKEVFSNTKKMILLK
jgi:photosystem II stability/assembly factor-like uncharacterized protein